MIFWSVIALMIATIIIAAKWSLAFGHDVEPVGELSVYRDQLQKIGRARAAGLIGESEAEAARVEVSQRLIAAADAVEFKHPIPIGSRLWRFRAAVIAGVVLLPVSAIALYLLLSLP